MACATCEKTREWTKRQLERSKASIQLCLERLGVKANRTERSAAEESEHIDRAKQPTDSNQQ